MNKPTRELSLASAKSASKQDKAARPHQLTKSESRHHNKAGEEKPRGPVYLGVVAVGVVIICLLVAIILNISTKTTATVLTKQKDYTLSSTTVVKGLFAVSSLRYADVENASCTLADNYQRPVSLVLRMHAYEVPESCSLFVDQVLIRTERKLSPDCKESCDFTEFDRGISVGLADYRDDHVLRVCCNQICIEEILPSLCGQPEKKVAVATPLPDKKNLYLSLGIGIGLIVFVSAIVIVSHHQRKL